MYELPPEVEKPWRLAVAAPTKLRPDSACFLVLTQAEQGIGIDARVLGTLENAPEARAAAAEICARYNCLPVILAELAAIATKDGDAGEAARRTLAYFRSRTKAPPAEAHPTPAAEQAGVDGAAEAAEAAARC